MEQKCNTVNTSRLIKARWSVKKCFPVLKRNWVERTEKRQMASILPVRAACEKPPKISLHLIQTIDFNLTFPLRTLLILMINCHIQTLTRAKHQVRNFLLILLRWGQVFTSVHHPAAPTVTDFERDQYSVYTFLMTSIQLSPCQHRNWAFMKIRSSLWWSTSFFFKSAPGEQNNFNSTLRAIGYISCLQKWENTKWHPSL